MGGFVIRGYTDQQPESFVNAVHPPKVHMTTVEEPTAPNLPLVPSNQAFESHDQRLNYCGQEIFCLTAASILRLRKLHRLPKMPSITLDDIYDKNKNDSFARVVSVAQISWITVQVLARVARGLAVSQLEIAVVAFASCAIITYALDWKKPRGVLVPHTLMSFEGAIPRPMYHSAQLCFETPYFSVFFPPSNNAFFALRMGQSIRNDVVAAAYSYTRGPNPFLLALTWEVYYLAEFISRHGVLHFRHNQSKYSGGCRVCTVPHSWSCFA